MKKKYAFYCSGGASRIIKFYEQYAFIDYFPEFILYDGNNEEVRNYLKTNFSTKVYNFDSKLPFSDFLLQLLTIYKVDFLFCFGSRILKGSILESYENKIINFHPSILPSFPGINSIDQALNSTVQLLGNTAHFIDKGIDTGPIIMQSAISRSNFKSYEDVLSLQINMLSRIWNLLEYNKIYIIDGKVIIDEHKNTQKLYS